MRAFLNYLVIKKLLLVGLFRKISQKKLLRVTTFSKTTRHVSLRMKYFSFRNENWMSDVKNNNNNKFLDLTLLELLSKYTQVILTHELKAKWLFES